MFTTNQNRGIVPYYRDKATTDKTPCLCYHWVKWDATHIYFNTDVLFILHTNTFSVITNENILYSHKYRKCIVNV